MRAKPIFLAGSILGFGVCADRFLTHQPGIGLTLLTAAGLCLFALAAPARRWAWVFLGAAMVLMSFAGLRAAGWLTALDALAAWTLAAVGATFAIAGDPTTESLGHWIRRTFRPLACIPDGIRLLVPRRRGQPTTSQRVASVGTVAAVVLVTGAFVVVLAQADPVFAHVVGRPFQFDVNGETLFHGVAALCIAVAASAVIATAQGPVTFGVSKGSPPTFATWSWTAVLSASTAVFALFLLVHLPTLYLGREDILARIGVTPASYAREGYAQMVAAAILTLALVGSMWVTGGAKARATRLVAVALLGLNLVVLASAYHRLTDYEHAFGWTMPRLLGHLGILWLGAVLVVTIVSLIRADLRVVPAAMVGLAVIALLALNLLNPDAFIARQNLARTGQPDVYYLSGLSEDAVPAMIEAARDPARTRDERAALTEAIRSTGACDTAARPWFSWNLAHTRAVDAAPDYC